MNSNAANETVTSRLSCASTGEVLEEVYIGDKVNIVRKGTMDYLEATMNVPTNFIKLNVMSADMLSRNPNIKESSFRICMRLLQYINYETGMVTNKDGATMSAADIERLCDDMSSRTVKRSLDELCRQDVFIKVYRKYKKKVYFIANPCIFMKGKRVNKTLLELFKDTPWAKTLHAKN